jgi:hypothetical protein
VKQIAVDSTVKGNVLGFRDYIFSIIFNNRSTRQMIRPMISFRARRIDKKMLTFLKIPYSNTAGTLLVFIKQLRYGNTTRSIMKTEELIIY